MAIPNLSNSLYVAKLRYIQTIHESGELRNPDTLVGKFIPMLQRLRFSWIGRADMAELRADPFYYYLIARTKYYDSVFQDAIADGVKYIVGVGCGSDTRAYRFKELLSRNGINVLECDQPESIAAKEAVARRWPKLDHVEFLGIDLNDGAWPELERRFKEQAGSKTLVLMEGVSPYVDTEQFGKFLRFIATSLHPGSEFAYDYKIAGVKDDFGRMGRTKLPFRLTTSRDEVEAFHENHGLRLEHMELSSELCPRLIPSVNQAGAAMFLEDCLLRLRVG